MDEFKQRLIHLHHCQNVGWKTIFTLLKQDPELQSLYNSSSNPLYLSRQDMKSIHQQLHSLDIAKQMLYYQHSGVHCITIFDKEYPFMLRETYQPPWVIYAKGDTQLLNEPRLLAVVGSRDMTAYGKRSIEVLFPSLLKNKVVIVSGLASGVDAYAHVTAMKQGGRTIGVIAGGFSHLYPKENLELAKTMMKKHVVISEYPPEVRPQKWHFPMRNRIISGLCSGTLVVEAKKRSGSLITANYAVNEGREVFAIPGPITSLHSVGANELIQQGAKLVNSYSDILDELR